MTGEPPLARNLPYPPCPVLPRLVACRRASVAVLTALVVPVLLVAGAFVADAALWRVTALDLQHRADAAALAGAAEYATSKSAQSATAAAASAAAVNGLNGKDLKWNAATLTTSNGAIAAAMTYGLVATTKQEAIRVTLTRVVPFTLAGSVTTAKTAATVTATAIAEMTGSGGTPAIPAPCFGTLGGETVTSSQARNNTYTLSFANSAQLTASGCTVWVNGSIYMTGGSITAKDIHLAGTFLTSNSPTRSGTEHPGSELLSDPYAGVKAVTDLTAGLKPGTGAVLNYKNGNFTVSPGSYASWTFGAGANVTLTGGTYWVNGDIAVQNTATLAGVGVTIVTSGTVTFTASAVAVLSAPGGSPAGAMVLVSTNKAADSGINFTGGTLPGGGPVTHNLTGIVYGPSAVLTTLNSNIVQSATCLEFLVLRAKLTSGQLRPKSCATFAATPVASAPALTQ